LGLWLDWDSRERSTADAALQIVEVEEQQTCWDINAAYGPSSALIYAGTRGMARSLSQKTAKQPLRVCLTLGCAAATQAPRMIT